VALEPTAGDGCREGHGQTAAAHADQHAPVVGHGPEALAEADTVVVLSAYEDYDPFRVENASDATQLRVGLYGHRLCPVIGSAP
jgi:hypothetical protein